jgi:hypothetical protein
MYPLVAVFGVAAVEERPAVRRTALPLVAVGLSLGGDDYRSAPDDGELLAVDTQSVDTVRIDGDEQSVVLARGDDGWVVQSMDFPAQADRVNDLLDTLASLNKGWPVATTEEAAERFKVAEDDYKRKITLLKGDEALGELYIGSSPGVRKVHARAAGDNNIHSIEFNLADAGVETDAWADKGILQREAEGIARVELSNGITLERREDKVVVAGLGENERTDTAEAEKLLNSVAGIRIRKVLGKETDPEWGLDEPVHTIALTPKEGESVRYAFGERANGDGDGDGDAEQAGAGNYVLKSSGNAHYFEVARPTVDNIFNTERDKLVRPAEDAEPAGQDANQAEETPDG